MNDEFAQFLIAVYELCLTASLGRVRIEVHSQSGERTVGVPMVPEGPGSEWPGDGTRLVIEIDQAPVRVEQITACTIFAPPR